VSGPGVRGEYVLFPLYGYASLGETVSVTSLFQPLRFWYPLMVGLTVPARLVDGGRPA